MTDRESLEALCRLCGIDPEYNDVWGKHHQASPESMQALLGAMGINAVDDKNVQAALTERGLRSWRRMLTPVAVIHASTEMPSISVIWPVSGAESACEWRLVTEDGRELGGKATIADLEIIERRNVDGKDLARAILKLPGKIPEGYHRFEIRRAADVIESQTLIATPDACFQPPVLAGEGRVWGPAVQLYALRSRRNWGIGDFTDLRRLVEICRESGADIVGLNPLHALFPHNPAHASPYSPSSRQFLNILYIDVETIPEFSECEPAKQVVATPEFQARLQGLRSAETVDYSGVAAMKLPVLELLYQHFRTHHLQNKTERAGAFRSYVGAESEALYSHALYEALQEHFYAQDPNVWGWGAWPEVYRNPQSPEVKAFADRHRERVEFFQYLQWQADSQLAAIGQFSLRLHLGVGLYQDLAVSVDRAGSEVWAHQSRYANGVSIGSPPDNFSLSGQNWGLPPWVPDTLVESAYAPFISMLRANMCNSGALRIDHVMGLMRLFWVPPYGKPADGAYVYYPFEDLLGIVALESQRNRCLVIGEDLGTVPDAVRTSLAARGVLSYRLLYFEKDAEDYFKSPAAYPVQALVAVSTHDLPTLPGFWFGEDLSERAGLGHFPTEADRDKQVVGRATDRARLLLALDREQLLPPDLTVHPVSSPEMTPELMCAIHDFLGRAPSKIMLVQIEDVLGQRRQVNLPGTSNERPNWRYKIGLDLEDLLLDTRWRDLALRLRPHRSPAPAPALAQRQRPALTPTATYRLQFHRDFTFAQATDLVPYLRRLGVSHCYASPYLKARAGSSHGYDIVDHHALNPEIGNAEDYQRFVQALHEHDMGQILDIVPNHMGVGGDDNHWWMDVLENGQTSVYAEYFDIDWYPLKDDLRGKVLSPVLGDHYGKLLENGEIKLVFEAEQGGFAVRYYNHRFPVDPQTSPLILHHDIARLESLLGTEDSRLLDFQSLITALRNLPLRSDNSEHRVKERRRDKEVHKRRLVQLARNHAEIRRFIEENIATLNGIPGDPGSFNLLHALLEAQAYRLANWRVASDEINYRRFFDVNELAGLRTENPEVFESTHRLIFELIATDKVDGLRIDHPDGLYNPAEYYERLQRRLAELTASVNPPPKKDESASQAPTMYVIAEKILASHERLPEGWSVHGTTGYEFANLVNGLFVYAPAERDMDRIYRRFSGVQPDFEEMLYDCKKLVMRTALSSELHVLANYLDRISESDRYTRDYTRTAQRSALFEVVASFPVYRTYVTAGRITEEDRCYVDWAIAAAKRRNPAADITIYDFIRRILLLEDLQNRDPSYRNAVVEFVMRFQQYTAPVMAKGLEDTLFYRQNRLTSLNEVGGDPRRFAVSIPVFHFANQERQRRWPASMLCTSSHDTKRSEDVRARINVLSELSGEWRMHLSRWNHINRGKKRRLGEATAPSQNDEYLLYQTLLGVWPSGTLDASTLGSLRDRISAYMRKAIREAKVHTSWINPNLEYEEGVDAFVQALLQSPERNLFLDDFLPFQRRVAGFGQLNSLSQALLKLTSPGVPDIYQGTELFDLSLVDPDNRRPVDYAARMKMLEELNELPALDAKTQAGKARALLNHLEDGTAKLYLTWRALCLRRSDPELFAISDYLALEANGERAEHICAYARSGRQKTVITIAPRWFTRLISDAKDAELFEADTWADTFVELPDSLSGPYMNVLTGEQVSPVITKGQAQLKINHLLKNFPVALLST